MSIERVRSALAAHPEIQLAIVFGSVARGQAHDDSDVDVAVQATQTLTAEQKMQLIGDIALATNRAVDLVDLHGVGEPLLGQILKYGQRIRGSDDDMAALMRQHVFDMEDFVPYVERMLAEKRQPWTS